ncbi:MAG: phosphoenolpyruvate carboxykinase (ATP) [bacterium]
MAIFDGKTILERIKILQERSRHVGRNVTLYTGPELGRLALLAGQRNIFGGYNWDTKVRNRSAKYSVIIGSEAVSKWNTMPEQIETLKGMDKEMTRIFGGESGGKKYEGHTNMLPIDLVHRVMGSGEDVNFTFNCYLMVTTKNRANHHIGYMWGKMCRIADPVPGADDLYILLVPDMPAGDFGRFYAFPGDGVTIGIGSDYMGEAKKGFLRMAMYNAKRRGILGIHAGTKIVKVVDSKDNNLKTYAVVIFGNSGTGKTTNVGHTHFLDKKGEQALIVQDDFAGLRMKDGRILGTEQALFLKTDLDEEDILLRPATESAEFVAQNLYVDYQGNVLYLEEDLCANGRGILPLAALPKERRYHSIDLPPFDELDGVFFIFNTRRNTVTPILQELTPEQAAAYFMLGESIETAAGDPAKAGQSIRTVGTNPFVVGDPAEEGNIFYQYLLNYKNKVRSFLMNTGGVGEIAEPGKPPKVIREAVRPWKSGIGYITRALLRSTAKWEKDADFGTQTLVGGVTGENDDPFDMDKFDPRKHYDTATREKLVKELNQERVKYLEKFETLDPKIKKVIAETHLL